MITWRKIKHSLDAAADERLDDPAVIDVDSELVQFDILQVDVPEIGDDRLVGYLQRGRKKTTNLGGDDCPYCGGNCARDGDGCDGYLGDIDHLMRDEAFEDYPFDEYDCT